MYTRIHYTKKAYILIGWIFYTFSFSRANNFHRYAVLVQAFYGDVLPPPEAKRS
jgi:hypothetical protein